MICEMCGEPISGSTCPFCGTVQSAIELSAPAKSKAILSFNIKEDLPTSETAIKRVEDKISEARHKQAKALKIIHGYGSSGKGGVIKQDLHRFLHTLYNREKIQSWIPGEEFSADYSDTLEVLKYFPFLENDKDFRQCNKGITVIVL